MSLLAEVEFLDSHRSWMWQVFSYRMCFPCACFECKRHSKEQLPCPRREAGLADMKHNVWCITVDGAKCKGMGLIQLCTLTASAAFHAIPSSKIPLFLSKLAHIFQALLSLTLWLAGYCVRSRGGVHCRACHPWCTGVALPDGKQNSLLTNRVSKKCWNALLVREKNCCCHDWM